MSNIFKRDLMSTYADMNHHYTSLSNEDVIIYKAIYAKVVKIENRFMHLSSISNSLDSTQANEFNELRETLIELYDMIAKQQNDEELQSYINYLLIKENDITSREKLLLESLKKEQESRKNSIEQETKSK